LIAVAENSANDFAVRASERMRESARWFIAGLAGLAVILFAGVRVAAVGELVQRGAWDRVLWTAAGYALAGTSLTIAVSAVWSLARGGYVTIEDLKTAEAGRGDLAEWLSKNRYLLRGQESVDDLWLSTIRAQEDAGRAYTTFWDGLPDEPDKQLLFEAQLLQGNASRLASWVSDLLTLAGYQRMSQHYERARNRLTVSAIGVVLGVAVLAFSSSLTSRAQVSEAVPVLIQLSDQGIRAHSETLGGESCARGDLYGVAVDGPLAEPVVVLASRPSCPPARFTVGRRDGVAVPQAAATTTTRGR
jgi:hypothetical protein